MEQLSKSLETLLERDQRYPIEAYGVALSALSDTISRLERPRHISGAELARGFRRYALDQFGPMTLTVLEAWNLRATDDLGAVVFNLIEIGLLNKSAEDRLEDFQGLYSFQEVFGGPYQYLAN